MGVSNSNGHIHQRTSRRNLKDCILGLQGLVPALVHHGRNLNESQVIMEYLEDITGPDKSLYPKDPFDRAVARLWIDHAAKKIVPSFFRTLQAQVCRGALVVWLKSIPLQSGLLESPGCLHLHLLLSCDVARARELMHAAAVDACWFAQDLLCFQEEADQKAAQAELLKNITEFVEAMDPEGPFFFGQQFTMTDIALIPWLLRQPHVLKQYKGFELPTSGSPIWDRCHHSCSFC